MKICREVEEWITENVEQEVKKQERRCKKWPWPLSWLCSLVTFIVRVIVTVTKKIVRVVCEVVSFLKNLAAALINLILAIPIWGAWWRTVINFFVSIASYIIGLADGALSLVGVRITKHLRVHIIPLCNGDIPLANEHHLTDLAKATADILYRRAKIRAHFTFHEPLRNPPESALRVGTNADTIFDEAWLKGSWHQLQTIKLFDDQLSLLTGIGAPIVAYIVQEVGYDGLGGPVVATSTGPFGNWVAIERDSAVSTVVAPPSGGPVTHPVTPYPPPVAIPTHAVPTANPFYVRHGMYTLAHELGHSLGLVGHLNSGPQDLMYESTLSGDALSPFQVGIIRGSRHLTYW